MELILCKGKHMVPDGGANNEKLAQLAAHLFRKSRDQNPTAKNIDERNLIWNPEWRWEQILVDRDEKQFEWPVMLLLILLGLFQAWPTAFQSLNLYTYFVK